MQPNESEVQNDQAAFDPNSTIGTFVVALVLCVVCALGVSAAAVALKAMQEKNAQNKMQRNVLIAAGIWDESKHTDADIPDLFESIEPVLWNLPTANDPIGAYNKDLDPKTYDQGAARSTVSGSTEIHTAADIAGIKRREKTSVVYLVKGADGQIESIVLPIAGKGLWSTLYGFLAVDATTTQSRGITFYKHGETPGLGGEVDNPKWKFGWSDPDSPLLVRELNGAPVLNITKPGNKQDANEIDGLSGATITSNGVENTVRYWLGPDAFGPFLDQFAKEHGVAPAAPPTEPTAGETAVTPAA